MCHWHMLTEPYQVIYQNNGNHLRNIINDTEDHQGLSEAERSDQFKEMIEERHKLEELENISAGIQIIMKLAAKKKVCYFSLLY